jgi:serine/threonine protein kinase
MVSHAICPPEPRLKDLIEGKLPDAEEVEVAHHIEHCEKCQRAVEQLAPARDELLPLHVNGAEVQLETREQALKQAMDRLHADGSKEIEAECEPMSDDDALKILSTSDKADSLGRLGPYEVTKIIGRGGMGTVFKAIDATLDRIVAVKVLSPSLASNGTARKRFVREARSAAAVVHDHVITIHAVDETGGQPYLVMQFVSGMSLQEKIDRSGPLEVKEILRIAKQIASGLAAAHEQGLVHRDIKPSNILLENGVERVMITDFGLARAMDDASLTRSGVIAGTPQYMSPEQAQGETVDHRADLFSLGSVMYAMGTGHSPFRAETAMAVLRRVCEHRPRPIREVNPEIPVWLAEIIEKLLAKEPGHRFREAGEVARLLERHLAHLQHPTTVPMPPRLATVPAVTAGKTSFPRRHRVAVGLIVAGLAMAAAVLATMDYLGPPAAVRSLPATSVGGREDTGTSGRRVASLPSLDDQQPRVLDGPEWEEEVSQIRDGIGNVERNWFKSSDIAPDVTWSKSVLDLKQRLDDLRRQLNDPAM